MYSAETTIVDVKQTGESEYTLSMTAKELYVAAQSGDVLRRHDVSASDKAPEKKYVALSGVKFAEATGKYTFTFASGDVMEASSADAYPTASSISDSTDELPAVEDTDKGKFLHANESTGALEWASGGRFVVTFSYDSETEEWSADKTFAECVAAWEAGQTLVAFDDRDESWTNYIQVTQDGATVSFITFNRIAASELRFVEYGIGDGEVTYAEYAAEPGAN